MANLKTKQLTTPKGLQVTLRSPIEADAADILELIDKVIAERKYQVTEPGEYALNVEDQKKWIQKMSTAPADIVIVAEFHNRIVGMIDFHQNARRRRLKHTGSFGMSVVSEYREHGIGTVLVEELLSWARLQPEIEKVCLSVFSNNPRAIHLYKKLGFHEEGRRVKEIKVGSDEYWDEILMFKMVKQR
ncbi:MAG: N-acetyltransferase [Oligoflexia bacterium]|nr:MAG: N-acetyltransferase [Oligoflexia bacterium]